jgi:hemoglobin/transferrin/lactoferrin receptor protein
MTGWTWRTRALLLEASTIALVASGVVSHAQPVTELDPITIVATKTEEKAIASLAAVSTVRQDQINQIAPSRLSDVFFGMPGVTFQERGDDPATAINIRGLQDFGRVAVVVDGARQNFQTTGHNANGVFYLDPELLAGVDVVRGPVANIYGSGAIGGVAAFRTKDVGDVLKFDERWGGLAHIEGGSNDARMLGSLFGAAHVGPNVDLLLGGLYRSSSNYKDGDGVEVPNTGYNVGAGIAKATIRPAEGHEVKLSAITQEYNFTNGQTNGPGSVNNESNFLTHLRNDIVSLHWKYSRPDDKLLDFDNSVYWTRTMSNQLKTLDGTPGSSGNAITGFVGDGRTYNIETSGFDLHNTSRFETGPVRHALTYGIDYFHDDVHVTDPSGTADLFTPSGQRSVYGGFGQWKLNYSSWLEVLGAARYDGYDLSGGGVTNTGNRVSPKITVGITPVEWLTLYGTYAEGYRAPSISETLIAGNHPPFASFPGAPNGFTFVPNPTLKPEVGHNKEIGVNIRKDDLLMAGDRLRVKANVFQNDVSDYINSVMFGPVNFWGIPSQYQFENVTSARLEGVEFEGSYDAGDWFAGLSGQHIRGKDVMTGMPLTTIQPDQIATTLGVRMLDRKLTMSVRWAAVAAQKAVPTGTPPSESYNLMKLYIGYQPTPDVLAAFTIDNLLNEQYTRYLDFLPSPGITYKASLRVRFGA